MTAVSGHPASERHYCAGEPAGSRLIGECERRISSAIFHAAGAGRCLSGAATNCRRITDANLYALPGRA